MQDFPIVEQDATFFVVTCNGIDIGTFSAFQIREMFSDDADSFFEFDQDFSL